MNFIISKSQAQDIDKALISKHNVPSIVLMENAAKNIATNIINLFDNNRNIYVICGKGNNGGDGLAIARHLHLNNFKVYILFAENYDKLSLDSEINYNIIKSLNIPIINISTIDNLQIVATDIIIDAIYGTGGNDILKQDIIDILNKVNNINCNKIAIDSPTGLNLDTGITHPSTFIADITFTMIAPKLGFYLAKALDYCGHIIACDLGIKIDFLNSNVFINSTIFLQNILKIKNRFISKFDRGRLTIIAGTPQYTGAAGLAANAAMRSGAGLVHLISTIKPRNLDHSVIFNSIDKYNISNIENYFNLLNNSSAILIGPGLGFDKDKEKMVDLIIDTYQSSKLIIIDADALNAIKLKKQYTNNVVITPHLGELANIIGSNYKDIFDTRYFEAQKLATHTGLSIVAKGYPTYIFSKNKTYINLNGNSGMAKAGTGDVLAGITASLLSQFGLDALPDSVNIHSLAGDIAQSKYTSQSMTATNIISCIEHAFKEII